MSYAKLADLSLEDATNSKGNTDLDGSDGTTKKWSEPEKYDYKLYNAATREEREEAEREAAERDGAAGTTEAPTWAANAAKYEWLDEYGDVGPPHPELEKMLFSSDHINRRGRQFDHIASISVTIESERKILPVARFEDAGLHPIMLRNIELCGYDVPTPIQAYCLPAILKNHDVIAAAQTGSGKTAAFLIPTLSKLMGKAKKLAAPRPNLTVAFDERRDGLCAEPLILIVSPTRELATQIFDEARRLCYRSMLRPCVAYGGAPAAEQAVELRKGCDVLIATAGRLIDFLNRGNLLSLRRVKYTIVDEADEMVNPDWVEEMKVIMSGADNNEDADHIFMMFSATFPKEARALAKEFMANDHIRIRVGRTGSTHRNIKQDVFFVDEPKKRAALHDLLMSTPPARTIVFVNNKKAADFIDDFLYNKGLPSTSIHSDRTQREREDALRAFKSGKAPILVATGVSARGLDIKHVMHVINYDLPSTQHGGIHEYVHRIGRTARIGNIGVATSFYNDRNEDIAESLVKLLVESGQVVPDFLEQHKPADSTHIDFEDDTDNEGEGEGESGGNAGAGGLGEPASAPAGDTWGGHAAASGDDDWTSTVAAPVKAASSPPLAAPAAPAASAAPTPAVWGAQAAADNEDVAW